MSSDTQDVNEGISFSVIGQIVGVFALVGVGIGLTGGVAISQLGSGGVILSGILILVVLTIAFLLGPVIGVITGLQTGDQYGRTNESYLAGLIGSVTGYFVMMFTIFLILSAILAIVMGDSGSGSTVAQSATTPTPTTTSSTSSSGGPLPIGDYIVPIIAVAIPTGITGIGGVYFGGTEHIPSESTRIDLPWKYVGIAIIIIAVLTAGVTIGPELLSPDPQPQELEITGGSSTTDTILFAEGTITNPTDTGITTAVTIELVIDGLVATTTEEEITVSANSDTSIRTEIATVDDLTNSQVESVATEDYELRYIIANQTVETYQA